MDFDEERTASFSYSSLGVLYVNKPDLCWWFQMNRMYNRNVRKVLKVLLVFESFQGRILVRTNTAQKMKFSIKDFFSECDQIRRKPNLLKKSLMENFIFCAV